MMPNSAWPNQNGTVDPQGWFDSHSAPGTVPPLPPTPTLSTRNLLSNASFENGSAGGWVNGANAASVQHVAYDGAARSREGHWFMEANTSVSRGSLAQDVAITTSPGQSYAFSVWLRSPTGTQISGTVSLWGLGGTQEQGHTDFTVGSDWTLVTAPLDVANAGHTLLRAEIYMSNTGVNYDFDGASLARGGARVPPPIPDLTPPTTTPAGADTLWHNTPVTVTFSATDNAGGSGVVKTEYKLDAGAWTTGTSCLVAAPADHSKDGTHTVAYRSTDAAGNTEAQKTLSVKIDTTLPSLTWGSPSPTANAAGWYNALVTLPWSAGDALSGLATAGSGSLSFSADGAKQTKTVTVRDLAGNTATFTSAALNIDRSAPKLTATASPATSKPTNKAVSVTVVGSGSDALSGLTLTSGRYSVRDSRGTTIPGGSFSFTSSGSYSCKLSLTASLAAGTTLRTYTISVQGTDKAGNLTTATVTFTVK
jgi:hypothetical protein